MVALFITHILSRDSLSKDCGFSPDVHCCGPCKLNGAMCRDWSGGILQGVASVRGLSLIAQHKSCLQEAPNKSSDSDAARGKPWFDANTIPLPPSVFCFDCRAIDETRLLSAQHEKLLESALQVLPSSARVWHHVRRCWASPHCAFPSPVCFVLHCLFALPFPSFTLELLHR